MSLLSYAALFCLLHGKRPCRYRNVWGGLFCLTAASIYLYGSVWIIARSSSGRLRKCWLSIFYNNLIIFILLEDISFRKYFRPSGIFFKLLFPVSSVLLQNGPIFLKNISISNNLIINHLWNSIKIYLKKDENKFAGLEKVRTFASAIENKTTATQKEFFERF